MRSHRTLVITTFFLLIFNSSFVQAGPDPTLSGRLIFENVTFSCEHQCYVTLLVSGARPVETVLADFSGHFTFNNVPRGMYAIRVEIDGYETVNQTIDSRDAGFDVNIIVPLVRKPKASAGGGGVVDVSQFMERYPKKAVSFFEKGSEALKKKKQDEAVKYLKGAVELAPTFYEAHYQLGVLYRQLGQAEDAEHEFVKAHELNSSSVEPLMNLTAIYLDRNDPERAVKTSEQAVKANSRSAPAFFAFGFALYRTGAMDRAEDALKRALSLDPKMGNARLMLANVYLKLGQYDSTLQQINSYIAENPQGQQVAAATEMRNRLTEAMAASEAETPDTPAGP